MEPHEEPERLKFAQTVASMYNLQYTLQQGVVEKAIELEMWQ